MNLSFCTLFDSNYANRGVQLYNSLSEHCNDFRLYVLAMDESVEELGQKMGPHVTVIPLKDLEDAELLKVKKGRTTGEYCWTCTPVLISYCLEKYELDHITYVDADIFFYSSPAPLFEENREASVFITPHWYSPENNNSCAFGIYCVQFLTIKADTNGLKVLSWWKKACLNWCFARVEDGKFGDQKYLDCWPYVFEGVHVIKNRGAGVAPWNLSQYTIRVADGTPIIKIKETQEETPMIFFHFHDLKFLENRKVELTNRSYNIEEDFKNLLYFPYINLLLSWSNLGSISKRKHPIRNTFRYLRKYLGHIYYSFLPIIKGPKKRTQLIYDIDD